MPPVFQTNNSSPHVEISGLPVLPADGKGGVLVERAAEVLPQLQNDDGGPLTGASLKSAAEALAEEAGVRVAAISEAKADKLPQIAGGYADRPPAAEVAQDNYTALHGPLEADAPGTPDTTTEPAASGQEG